MYITVILCLLFLTSLILVVLNNRKKTQQIVEKIKGGALLIDVRTQEEYKEGAIEGSIHIPLQEITQKISKLDPDQYYLTYCSHGVRSIKALKILRRRGVKHVYNGGSMSKLQKLIDEKNRA
tara:strand:+ start:35192 stop:35557 length:366 start_codon:yes stop_codon:yes gene_type:complete